MEDEGAISSCCMDDPEAAEADPDSFDCESCQIRILREQLGPDDSQAMEVYGRLASPVVRELGLYPLAWAALGLKLTRPQANGLLDRLARLHQHTRTLDDRDRDQEKGEETTRQMGKTSIRPTDPDD
jgi:hypothetical protein